MDIDSSLIKKIIDRLSMIFDSILLEKEEEGISLISSSLLVSDKNLLFYLVGKMREVLNVEYKLKILNYKISNLFVSWQKCLEEQFKDELTNEEKKKAEKKTYSISKAYFSCNNLIKDLDSNGHSCSQMPKSVKETRIAFKKWVSFFGTEKENQYYKIWINHLHSFTDEPDLEEIPFKIVEFSKDEKNKKLTQEQIQFLKNRSVINRKKIEICKNKDFSVRDFKKFTDEEILLKKMERFKRVHFL